MAVATAGRLDKFRLFEEIGWLPHEGQQAVLNSVIRNRVLSAGRRFGKSEIGGHELVPEAILTWSLRQRLENAGHRREFWIVGPEYTDAEKEFRVVYNTLKKMDMPFDRPGTYNNPLGGDLHISLFGGLYQVHGKSAKYPDSLVGEGLSGVIMAEAAKLKERVWTKYIRPTLADFQGWSIMCSTPEGKNWFYRAWQAGQDPTRPDWASWRYPSWFNPYVYRHPTDAAAVAEAMRLASNNQKLPTAVTDLIDPEILALLRDLSAETFNQEVGALFTEFVGRVFKEFDEELHVGDFPFDPSWETYAAVDYGFTNPSVWLLIQVGPFDDVRVIGEFYQHGLTVDEFATEIQRRGLAPAGLRTFYPDPASPGDSRALSQHLKVRSKGGTGGELKDRLELIRRALRVPEALRHLPMEHPERIPKLMIDRRCDNLIREMQDYRYPKSAEEAAADGKNAPELPMKKDDHAPEALGRFYAGHFGLSKIDRGGTRIRKASMTRGQR